MEHFFHNIYIAHSDYRVRFSNVRPSYTGNWQSNSEQVHKRVNAPESERNNHIVSFHCSLLSTMLVPTST